MSTVPHFHIYSESKVNIERKENSADVTSALDDRQLIEAHKSIGNFFLIEEVRSF